MITKETMEKIKGLVQKNYSSYRHFFESINSPEWLRHLAEAGFFSAPPPIEESEETIRTPPWPESDYLRRVAGQAPEEVRTVILNIPETKNPLVHEDLVLAAMEMPPNVAAKLVPKAVKWLTHIHLTWFLQNKYADLIVKLADGGEANASLTLARHLLLLVPNPRKEHFEELGFSADPVAKFDDNHYKEVVERVRGPLARCAQIKALKMFCYILSEAIRTEIGDETDRDICGPAAIENHEQNKYANDPMDVLVFAIRDTAEDLIQAAGVKVLKIVEKFDSNVYKRIGLHLRRLYPLIDPQATYKLLIDKKIVENSYYYHEIYLFMEQLFAELPREIQAQYFQIIDEIIDERRKYYIESEKELPQEEIENRMRRIEFDRLYPIREHLEGYDEKEFARFKELSKEFKPDRYPDLLGWIGDVEDVEPKQNANKKALARLSVEELVVQLEHQREAAKPEEDTLEGLGIILKELIKEDTKRFLVELDKLYIPQPEYIENVIEAFSDIVKQGIEAGDDFWGPVLELCLWTVKRERDEPLRKGHYSDICPGWRWARSSIAALLNEAFKADVKKKNLPLKYRSIIWSILEELADDPDPGKERNEEDTFEYYNQAINSVKGKTIEAVIRFGVWGYVHHQDQAENVDGEGHEYRIDSGARGLLKDHLDIGEEPSLAIRAMYGMYFYKLLAIDKEFAQEIKDIIFPQNPEHDEYFDAAWCAHIIFTPPYFDTFEALKNVYHYAIYNKLGHWPDDINTLEHPDKKLAEHLMHLYVNGKIEIDASLLVDFYEKAPGSVRKHALFFIGRELSRRNFFNDRVRALWDLRIKTARVEGGEINKEEISAFGWWFASADYENEWFIEQLSEVVKICGMVEDVFDVLERLVILTPEYPSEIIGILTFLVGRERENWFTPMHNDDLKNILVQISQHGDTQAKEEAADLVNKIMAMGYSKEYSDIYATLREA